MTNKTIHQIVDSNGQCVAEARSAYDWFIGDGTDPVVEGNANLAWGPMYCLPIPGNKVEFFTTGKAYFERVAAAIAEAQSSVFITGWQVNYDVELSGGRTLLHCLAAAVRGGANVYVMPWLAPPGPVDTGYLPTLLAVFHLNALPGAKGKAYCLPAPAQSDQETLGVAFSHHQKLVVIDNERAFTGGMDLAYGRRDDAQFSLKSQGRTHNEFYSSCVPAIKKLSRAEMEDCVTPAELLAAAFTQGAARSVATFATSPSEGVLARTLDLKDTASGRAQEIAGAAQDWWNNVNLLQDFTNAVQDKVMDGAQSISRWAWSQLDESLRARIAGLHETGAANAANVPSALVAWLSGGDLSRLPPTMQQEIGQAIHALVFGVVSATNARLSSSSGKPQHYARLFEKVRCVPAGAQVRDGDVQPRMPWQDVQCQIEGPAVFELARNFSQRWNSVAKLYETSFKRAHAAASTILQAVGARLPAAPKAPRIAEAHQPKAPAPKCGGQCVQVLRSAPAKLLKDEAKAAGEQASTAGEAQNNCLKAMVKAIRGAQHFIYIEGQFFQTDHGEFGETSAMHSGPMSMLLNLSAQPEFVRYQEMLEIKGATDARDILRRLRWAKVDDVLREVRGQQFMHDLNTVLKNAATVEAMRLLGKPQQRVSNPIGRELVRRIRRALNDELPFHVYLVVPVHPEGTLDTLNIMTQVHLTMHSLVFGDHSLVNGVRRAILAARYRKERKMPAQEAQAMAMRLPVDKLEREVPNEWQQYLTLLNLRTWDTIGGKPVTEQVYVHSKLLIADDRVAVLGSANINDRSMLGDRDSELAVIVTDAERKLVKLNGVHPVPVGASIHQLRRDLWEKLFGLKSRDRAASSVGSAAIMEGPAAPATWRAIQRVATKNAEAYEESFWFIPRSLAHPSIQPKEAADPDEDGPPGSIWPTWKYTTYLDHDKGGSLLYRMPFDPLFWRAATKADVVNSWNVPKDTAVQQLAPMTSPRKVQGFIVALPTRWTRRENNLSIRTHIRALAGLEGMPRSGGDPIQQAAIRTSGGQKPV